MESKEPTVTRGDLLAYLDPIRSVEVDEPGGRVGSTRVMQREDMQLELALVPGETETGE